MFARRVGGMVLPVWMGLVPIGAGAAPLAQAVVRSESVAPARVAEGWVEAVRQTAVAPQVAGAITALPVKPGDRVRAGQVLAQIDVRTADQTAQAGRAQAEAARAALDVARKDYVRQQQLFARQFISQAALDRAEAAFKAAEAQTRAQLALAGAAGAQAGLYGLKAPYAGVVADVPAHLGDMALPGQAVLTVYDPAALRVTATVPQGALATLDLTAPIRIELPALPADRRWQTAVRVTVLPAADAQTQSATLRLDLPAGVALMPGSLARVWLPQQAGGGSGRLFVPNAAVFRRAELQAVYVLDAKGQPRLRQVRVGPVGEKETEILSGVRAGERVALDPVAAARMR